MAKSIEARTYEEALAWLRDHGFDVTDAPGTNSRVFLRKYNVSAAIQKAADDNVKIFAYPGYLIGSEISKLVNRGYQQFLKTSKTELPATAEHLKSLQSFAEELKHGSRTAQPLQRIARNGQRSVSIRSRGKSRQGRKWIGRSVRGKSPESRRSRLRKGEPRNRLRLISSHP